MIAQIKEYRWPIGIVFVLFTVIVVNLAFTWVAMSEHYGAAGFERVDMGNAATKY